MSERMTVQGKSKGYSDGALLEACVTAATEAAGIISSAAAGLSSIHWESKKGSDFVSEVDRGAEAVITTVIHRLFPSAVIVGEELSPGAAADADLAFVVDPLDGTTNFLHGYPAYCVSICVALDGIAQAAVIHDVARGGVYTATLGGGAFVDGVPLKVSGITEPARALIGTGFPFKDVEHIAPFQMQSAALMPVTSGLRRAGAAALDLADVARGRFEGFWELQLMPWDMAAATLLIREAGGRVTDLRGNEAGITRGPIVASNGLLHEWLLEKLQTK